MTPHDMHDRRRRPAVLLLGTTLAFGVGLATAPAAAAADPEPFTISGNLSTALFPGSSGLLDLRLVNTNSTPLEITDLTVTLTGVTPRTGLTCSAADFEVEQYTADGDLVLDENDTARLSELGLTSRQLPRVRMLETNVNQDGCQGATLNLAYSGLAVGDSGSTGGSGDEDDDDGSDDVAGVDLPSTGGSGHEDAIALTGFGLFAMGGSALIAARRRKGARS